MVISEITNKNTIVVGKVDNLFRLHLSSNLIPKTNFVELFTHSNESINEEPFSSIDDEKLASSIPDYEDSSSFSNFGFDSAKLVFATNYSSITLDITEEKDVIYSIIDPTENS